MNHKLAYKVIRRKVKYPRIEIKTGNLVIIAPRDIDFDVENFVNRHLSWIESKFEFIKSMRFKFEGLKTEEKSVEELKSFTKERVKEFEAVVKAAPRSVRFLEMKTKWGSCSSAGNLTFNKLLRFLPADLISYVIYHEMCHLKSLKHGKHFWGLIEKRYPQHKEYEEKLFGYWFLVAKE